MTKPGDVDHYTRVRCYQARDAAATRSTPPSSRCCRSPCAWAARARRCSTPSSARTTAAPTSSSAATTPARATTRQGKPFYGPYDAQELMQQHEDELGVEMVPFKMVSYVEDLDTYMPQDEVPAGTRTLDISGTELRRRLQRGARPARPGSPSPRSRTSCGAPIRRATSRASRSSSPASRAPASRPSPPRCWSSSWRPAAGR